MRTNGTVVDLKAPIFHDDRKPLARWLKSQLGYAAREAAILLVAPIEPVARRSDQADWPGPILVFLMC